MAKTIKCNFVYNGANMYLIIAEIIISLLGCGSLLFENQEIWFKFFCLLSLIQLGIHLFYIYKIEKKIISFPTIFMILIFVFNFGHILVKASGKGFGKNILFPLWYVDFFTYKFSSLFVLLSQMMIFVGILFITHILKNKKKNHSLKLVRKLSNIPLELIVKIGFICVLVGIIPTLYIDVSRLILFVQGGYSNIFNFNVHDFIEVTANLLNFGIFALIIGFSQNKKIATSIFVVILIYKVIMMANGGRGETIVFIIGLFIVWESLVYKLSLKNILLLLLFCYIGLVLINFIASARNIPNFDFQKLSKIFISSLTSNQLTNALSEFGSTFSTLCFTVNSNPGPTFGINYFLPVLLILPNIGGFNSGVLNQMIFTKHINTFNQPIGGSFVAELFYSFHWFGWLFAFFIGCLIGFIAYKMYITRKEKQYFLYLIFAYTIPLLLFWIRGYFGAIYRELIWHCGFAILLVWFIPYIEKKIRKGKNV